MFALTVLVGLAVAAGAIGAGAAKVVGVPSMDESRRHLGLTDQLWRFTGVSEIGGGLGIVAGLAGAGLGVASAMGLSVVFAGAVAYHVRARDRLSRSSGAVLMLALTIAYLALRVDTA